MYDLTVFDPANDRFRSGWSGEPTVLNGPVDGTICIDLPPRTRALGFNVYTLSGSDPEPYGQEIQVTLSTGDIITLPTLNKPDLAFAGFVSPIPIASVRVGALTGVHNPNLSLFVYDRPACSLTVANARGSAAPGNGVITNAYGDEVSAHVSTPVLNGATQYLCTGATVTGNAFSSTGLTNVTLTLTNDASVTWNWQTQYRLTTATNGAGSVTAGGWQNAGSTVAVTAVSGPRTHFDRWTGDTNNCLIAGNVISAVMTRPRSITAVFAAGAQPVISGKITKYGTRTGVAGVVIQFSNGGGSATTDVNGNYSAVLPYNWTGRATPTYSGGGTFTATYRLYTRLILNKTLQNYTWTPPPVISGRITRTGTSTGVAGVSIVFSGVGTAVTDLNGYYTLSVPKNWTGTARPSPASGGTFTPVSRSYTRVLSNKTAQNFTWRAPVPLVVVHASVAADGASTAPVLLLRSAGTARWSGDAVDAVRQAAEILSIRMAVNGPEVQLPVAVADPADETATLGVEPAMQSVTNPSGGDAVTVRNIGGTPTPEAPLPGTFVQGTVTLTASGDDLFLTWDLGLFRK